MNYYLYLIFIPILIIALYVFIKLIYLKFIVKNKKTERGIDEMEEEIEEVKTFVSSEIKHVKKVSSEILDSAEEKTKEGFNEVREILWKYFDLIFDFVRKNITLTWHFVLHFIVLLLRFLSDMLDKLYAKSRNTFLYTATKEKGSVAAFWHHLKEYKKEVEEDWKKK